MTCIQKSIEVGVPISIAGDLDRFTSFIEDRGPPTGAGNRQIHGSSVTPS